MKGIITIVLSLFFVCTQAQELYVFTEPASNIPANALSVKLKEHFVTKDNIYNRFSNRFMPQLWFGVSKKLMLRAGASVSNMHTPKNRFESYSLYAKYRFLSNDDIHKHFRMAVYAEASKTNVPYHYDETSLMGDKGGIEAGIVATQLWHKIALSVTASHTQVLHKSRFDDVIYIPDRNYQTFNYSLSGGFLMLPKVYTSYKQVNLNLYLELLGQQALDIPVYYLDMAPAMQLIFSSNAKLNIGYRFQLRTTMQRMASNSWLISFERTFLNAFKKK